LNTEGTKFRECGLVNLFIILMAMSEKSELHTQQDFSGADSFEMIF